MDAMTTNFTGHQIVLNVEDQSILPSLKKVLKAIDGVTIVSQRAKPKKKSSVELAMDDIREGRVIKYDSLDDLIKDVNN